MLSDDLIVEEARARHEEIQNILSDMAHDRWIGLLATASWSVLVTLKDSAKDSFEAVTPYFVYSLPLIAVVYYTFSFVKKAGYIERNATFMQNHIEPLYRNGLAKHDGGDKGSENTKKEIAKCSPQGWEGYLGDKPKGDYRVTLAFWIILIVVNIAIYVQVVDFYG